MAWDFVRRQHTQAFLSGRLSHPRKANLQSEHWHSQPSAALFFSFPLLLSLKIAANFVNWSNCFAMALIDDGPFHDITSKQLLAGFRNTRFTGPFPRARQRAHRSSRKGELLAPVNTGPPQARAAVNRLDGTRGGRCTPQQKCCPVYPPRRRGMGFGQNVYLRIL